MNRFNKQIGYWGRLLIVTLLAISFGLFVVTAMFSYKQAQSYLHPARGYATSDLLVANNIEYQDIALTTEDGIKLSAWYTLPQNGALILVAHGYGDVRPADFYVLFASHGYGVLAWDFRAHGKSGGEFSSLGYYEVRDVKAALDYALAQPGVEHVGAWSGSMGAVAMIRAAAQYPQIEALVADSPFPTLNDELNARVPFPVIRPLIRFFAERESGVSMDLVRAVDDVRAISPRPVYIIQGMGDTMIPLDSAQRIFDAAGEPKFLWMEADVPHLNMYAYDRERYTKRVIRFFDEYLLGK
jgi:fermentation-respiration switch protein FrsA (DUF1100 family)